MIDILNERSARQSQTRMAFHTPMAAVVALLLIALVASPSRINADETVSCEGTVTNGHDPIKPEHKVFETRTIPVAYSCPYFAKLRGKRCEITIGNVTTEAWLRTLRSGREALSISKDLTFIYYTSDRQLQLKIQGGTAEEQRWFNGACVKVS